VENASLKTTWSKQRRFLSHPVAIGDKPSVCDIDEEPDAIDKDMHAASPVGML
jgi:hypothetical protein